MRAPDTTPLECRGPFYDPTLEAAELGVTIRIDADAPIRGRYEPDRRTIIVPAAERTHYRTAGTFQLAHAVLEQPSYAEAVTFASDRLIDPDDLYALATVTDDQRLWARVLRVREPLLQEHLTLVLGLPLANPAIA